MGKLIGVQVLRLPYEFIMKATKEYFRNYYKERKQKYINMLGGVCSICGSKNNLQFHHTDRDTKNFSIGKLMNYAEEKVLHELNKCVLICKSCHIEQHKKDGTFKSCGGRKENSCGKNAPNARKVKCIETGKEYPCIVDCAKDMGFDKYKNHISAVCNKQRKSYKGYTFEFI